MDERCGRDCESGQHAGGKWESARERACTHTHTERDRQPIRQTDRQTDRERARERETERQRGRDMLKCVRAFAKVLFLNHASHERIPFDGDGSVFTMESGGKWC